MGLRIRQTIAARVEGGVSNLLIPARVTGRFCDIEGRQ